MRAGVNALIAVYAAAAMLVVPGTAFAAEGAEGERTTQEGEDRWVPSFSITSGFTLQTESGAQRSFLYDGESADPSVPTDLRMPVIGDDRAVSPFVGATFELMTPTVPIPTRPRFFVTGEILPMFGPERQIATDGAPLRIKGPEIGAVLAYQEDNKHFTDGAPGTTSGPRQLAFTETEANGQGAQAITETGQLAWGAKIGISFPLELAGRQLRIKPSFGWLRYEVELKGSVVDPTCSPSVICTNTYTDSTGTTIKDVGFLREAILLGTDSEIFDGIGPGLDVEMDTGRFGPIGTALFIGVHGYYIFGNRSIDVSAAENFSDQLGNDQATATWEARVHPWIYRVGLGIRFQWLGQSR